MKFERAPYLPPQGKYQPRPAWLIAVAIVAIIGLSQCPSTSSIEDTSRQSLEQILLSVPSSEHARNWSHYYTTTGSHLPGQGLRQAEWTKAKWLEFGMTHVQIASYDTPLPTPTGQQRLVLLRSSESKSSHQEIIYKAPLTDTNSSSGFVPAYYGFSANANITTSYVFANFGSADDYQDLEQRGVTVDDKIVIIKSATQASSRLKHPSSPDMFRGVQIANAEARGAAGVLIYVDPQIDGGMTEGNGHRPFPDGLARPLTGIERGTLGSLEDFLEGSVPQIPAMPISTADAIELLRALNAYGPPAHELGSRWRGGALGYYGVGYSVGPSPPDLSLHLVSQASLQDGTVHNVIATIQGTVSDEVVILGNHRDAWGPGAGDPGSGSAALNEVVRSFGVALKTGWRPHRTIILASWEGEEYGQVGSTAWIRDNLGFLQTSAVAYLNVVVAAAGSVFRAKASPLLYQVVRSAAQAVEIAAGESVGEAWDGCIGTAGGGDAIRFQGIPCVATIDFGFTTGGLADGVFPYHTGFDSFEWMDTVGDPDWKHHVASARLWALMAANLAQSRVLPVSVEYYAVALRGWVDDIDDINLGEAIDLSVLCEVTQQLATAAIRFDALAESLRGASVGGNWGRSLHSLPSLGWSHRDTAIRAVNWAYIQFERQFFYDQGLDDTPSLHHVLYGPAAWHSEAPPLPGLRRSLAAGNWTNAEVNISILVPQVAAPAGLLTSTRDGETLSSKGSKTRRRCWKVYAQSGAVHCDSQTQRTID